MASGTHPLIPQICGDWVYSTGSNTHVAKDREWFTTYTPFETQIQTPDGTVLDVLGVGKVELSVRKTPSRNRSGRRAHAVLRLKNVLHVPTTACNVIGRSLAHFCRVDDHYGVEAGLANGCVHSRGGRERRGYFLPGLHGPAGGDLRVLRISGPPKGPYVAKTIFPRERDDGPKTKEGKGLGGKNGDEEGGLPDMGQVGARWLSKERKRWLSFVKEEKKRAREEEKAAREADGDGPGGEPVVVVREMTDSFAALGINEAQKSPDETEALQGAVETLTLLSDGLATAAEEKKENETSAPPVPSLEVDPHDHGEPQLNKEEKAWLKRQWGNEFKFLRCLGLNIHKDEHRAQGRHAVRSMMAMDTEDSDVPDSDDSETDGVLLYRR